MSAFCIDFVSNHLLFAHMLHPWADYVVIAFDMEVQPLVTHNAASTLCVGAICIDVASNHLLFAHIPLALLA